MVIRFLVGRTAKFFGRNVNLLFFTTLYREMYKELVDITNNETKASRILKLIGINGTFESARRQITVLRMFPNDPVKVMEYLDVIWYVIFGTIIEKYELEKISNQGKKYPDLVFRISKCPICGGYGTSDLDSIRCTNIQSGESYYAAGLVGMLEETANFILELKKNDYRIHMQETQCFCKGDSALELQCRIVEKTQFFEYTQTIDESLEIPFLVESDLNEPNDFLLKPFDAIKDQILSLVQEKMHMTTFEFMEYFRNYEEDVIRIVGFLMIHLINENGRIIEKLCENESVAKLIGHQYNNSLEMVKLSLPYEVLNDYKNFIIQFLTDIAPSDMIERFSAIEPSDLINLFYEGVKKALMDLGVDFQSLKANIWEELEIHKIFEQSSNSSRNQPLTEVQKHEQIDLKMQLIQEIFVFMMAVSSLPSRIILSSIHGTIKSMSTSGADSFSIIREQAEKVRELIGRLN